jgi:WhiB family redox-sensing transcriptional regulator
MARPRSADAIGRERVYALVERIMRGTLAEQLPNWQREAACVGTDPEIFYPVSAQDAQGDRAKAQLALIKVAKTICNGDAEIGRPPCPVRLECLAYAMERHERHGIWGGMTHNERDQLRKTRYERDRVRRLRNSG